MLCNKAVRNERDSEGGRVIWMRTFWIYSLQDWKPNFSVYRILVRILHLPQATPPTTSAVALCWRWLNKNQVHEDLIWNSTAGLLVAAFAWHWEISKAYVTLDHILVGTVIVVTVSCDGGSRHYHFKKRLWQSPALFGHVLIALFRFEASSSNDF